MTWPSEELEVLCSKIGSGATPRGGNSNYKTSGIALVRSMNVHLGRFKPDDLAFIDDAQAAKLSNVTLEPDDVLLNITGASVARCCTLDKTVLPARVNQHVCILRPEPNKLHYQYLMRYLTSDQTQRTLLRMAGAGATREAITKADIEKFQIPLPPLGEQKRIAAILDAADALRAHRRESLAQLDALLQSTFLEMFGDPVTNPMGWEECQLQDVAKKITDGTHKTPNYTETGVEFLSAKDIKNGEIQWGSEKFISHEEHAQLVKRCNPDLGDILLAKSGSLGAVAVVDQDREFSLFESLCLIKHDRNRIEAPFLTSMIGNSSMQSHLIGKNKGVAIKHLHLIDIRSLEIMLPPLDLQRRFAAIVESVEEQKARMRAHLAELDALFGSLQARAFNGEL